MTARKCSTRRLGVPHRSLAATILIALTASTFATAVPSRAEAATGTASTTTAGTAVIPQTIAGRRLEEVLTAARTNKMTTGQYTELFSKPFLAQVSLTQFVDILRSVLGSSVRITKVLATTETSISVVAIGVGGNVKVDLATDADSKIGGLLLNPYSNPAHVAPARSWSDIDKRLKTIAPNVEMVAAKIGEPQRVGP